MSKVEVNTIEPQCGTTVTVGKCTTTVAVPGNVIKSNAIQASDGGNIVSQSGTDITLGASGDTINLASGASQSGFGRTGTVDWDTGSIKTAGFTPVSGNGYFCNTTGGAFTVTLPAGSAGDIVGLSDYASTWGSNNITLTPNGSDKINGVNDDATLSTAGLAVTLVYADATRGWKSVTGSDANVTAINPNYIQATGGTKTTDGDYKVHTFTSPGTFCVSLAGTPCGSNTVDYMVVAGGGGGGAGCAAAGGGGAGGLRKSYPNPATGGFPVSVTCFPITVGAGGAGGTGSGGPPGTVGADTVFSTITSAGGGGGGKGAGGGNPGATGGSGGGGGRGGAAGAGNTPPSPCTQGTAGGAGSSGPNQGGGGGGGHSCAGGGAPPTQGAAGGLGTT